MRRRFMLAAVFAVACLASARGDADRARQLVLDGDARMGQRDMNGALDLYSRAIEEEPRWGTAWGKRGYCKRLMTRFNAALEDLSNAIALEPQVSEWRLQRAQCYMNLDRNIEALEEAEALMKLNPQDPSSKSVLGWTMIRNGEIDRGLELQGEALQASGNNAALRVRAEGLALKADWQGLLDESDAGLAGGNRSLGVYYNRVVALVGLERWDDAAAAITQTEAISRGTIIYMCRIHLMSTPAAGKHFDPARALADARQVGETTTDAMVLNGWARALFLNGHYQECLDLLVTKARRTNAEALFWLGAAHWKLGQFPEAREVLKDARRLNPYLGRHAGKIEGFGKFVASIDRELAGESGQQADRGRLGYELATHLLTIAEIEVLVRRYQFARAVAEYEKLLKSLNSTARKAEVEARLPEVRGMAGAHGKLVASLAKAPGKTKTRVAGVELTLQKGDDLAFTFTIPSGEGRFPWAFLETGAYSELAAVLPLTAEEFFGLGCLAWESGDRALAFKHFEEGVRKKADLKKNLAVFVARRRGIPVPESGFVAYRNGYVTPEEKANLEKGLVLFEGQWVTAKAREHLAKGEIEVAGKWVPGEEAELLKRGYRKYKGKWMSREDFEGLRGQWADAYIEETEHYTIRTNESEAFARDLALLAEAGYRELKAYYGGAEPKLKGKMELFAFRTYEDYRKYCVDHKAEDHLNAAGFAMSNSDTVVGWNKTSNRQQFLQTMIHEAAHLYFFRVSPMARPRSWYAEAMATYFEGFTWDGKGYKFSFVSESRLPFVRDAMKGGRHIPLKDLLDGNALQLINSDSSKALLFYAECWALNYFLCQTENKAWRAAYVQYREAVAAGQDKSLLEFFGDPAQLEKDWVAFVTGL